MRNFHRWDFRMFSLPLIKELLILLESKPTIISTLIFVFQLSSLEVKSAGSVISVLDKGMIYQPQPDWFQPVRRIHTKSESREGQLLPNGGEAPSWGWSSAGSALTYQSTVPQHLNTVHRAGYSLVTGPSGSPRQGKAMKQVQSSHSQLSQEQKETGLEIRLQGPNSIQETKVRQKTHKKVHLKASIQDKSYLQHRFVFPPGVKGTCTAQLEAHLKS